MIIIITMMILEATKEAETTGRNDSYKSLNPQEAKSKQNNNKMLQKKKRKKKKKQTYHVPVEMWSPDQKIHFTSA